MYKEKSFFQVIMKRKYLPRMRISLFKLENKFRCEYKSTMNYLTHNYKSLPHDYKSYYPNLIQNKGYIDHYQKAHRDCVTSFPKISVIIKVKKKLYLLYKIQ